jgi:hypothetical protein
MKKNIFRILMASAALLIMIGSTGCSNKYKDMQPGEVRLKENDYRNDDKICDIKYAVNGDSVLMTALEVRTIWHSVVISAEDNVISNDDNTKKAYDSPIETEETFFTEMQKSMQKMKDQYPTSCQAIIDELHRAEVKVYAHFLWCIQSEEYLDMKFEARP